MISAIFHPNGCHAGHRTVPRIVPTIFVNDLQAVGVQNPFYTDGTDGPSSRRSCHARIEHHIGFQAIRRCVARRRSGGTESCWNSRFRPPMNQAPFFFLFFFFSCGNIALGVQRVYFTATFGSRLAANAAVGHRPGFNVVEGDACTLHLVQHPPPVCAS